MCTVSILPTDTGFEVLHSRDELRSRSAEIEPSWRALPNGLSASWPTDPDAGGTWVAVREDGFFLGLLNLNLSESQLAELAPNTPNATRSRGLVIPALIESTTLAVAIESLKAMDLLGMKPFRLILAAIEDGQSRYSVARFDGVQLTIVTELGAIKVPECWASSGLGDALVQCRLPVFEQMVVDDPTPENQRAFHWHQWADRPQFSVMMSRADARTSSVTTIVVEPGKQPTVLYDPIAIGDAKCDPVGAGMLR